jgi:hypothetical protein
MTRASDRAARDQAMRTALADLETARHDAAAASELDRAYPKSRAVAGDDGPRLVPGVLLPDMPRVQPGDGDPRPLHELTHHTGHTLLVLGGPAADRACLSALVDELAQHTGPLVSAVHGLSTQPGNAPVGRIDDVTAQSLGVIAVTVLAVRPDRYIGLRDNEGRAETVAAYLDALTE